MSPVWRKRRSFHVPIWTSVVLVTVNITLLVVFIILSSELIPVLTIGIIAISLGLFGLSFYLVLTLKEIQLNRRQANFVDSVTHELKTPISSMKLYLQTLQMRSLADEQRAEFYGVMETELNRLDQLINQLLEVGRLDAIGHQSAPEAVQLDELLRSSAELACAHHKVDPESVLRLDLVSTRIRGRKMLLEMIFGNLLDNAIKYGGNPPEVGVEVRQLDRGKILVRISDNGQGVPQELRKKIFRLFYRGGDELERSKKGTGLGLYIVRTLVHMLKGRINVYDRATGNGSVFEVELTRGVER